MTTEHGSTPMPERERVVSEVVATNAVITDEQFQALKGTLGSRLTMSYRLWPTGADIDKIGRFTGRRLFTLLDFGYVVDPTTSQRYLAFLRTGSGEYDLHFPLQRETDIHSGSGSYDAEIERITDSTTETPLWSFDQPPGQALDFGPGSVSVKQLEESSISYAVTSAKTRELIDDYISYEKALRNVGWGIEQRALKAHGLEITKAQIAEMVESLGAEGVNILLAELREREEKARSPLERFMESREIERELGFRPDSSMEEFTEREGDSLARACRDDPSPEWIADKRTIALIREFLGTLQK
jgi:hypothetical protein